MLSGQMNLVRTALLKGEVVICPTETVYGLCVLERFRSRLDLIKNQPSSKPLAFVYSTVDTLLPMTEDPFTKEALVRLLPGPFTVLMYKEEETIGIRVPVHPFWLEFLDGITEPTLLTSANLSGEKPAADFQEAVMRFPELQGYDGGKSYGRASKLIDLRLTR